MLLAGEKVQEWKRRQRHRPSVDLHLRITLQWVAAQGGGRLPEVRKLFPASCSLFSDLSCPMSVMLCHSTLGIVRCRRVARVCAKSTDTTPRVRDADGGVGEGT